MNDELIEKIVEGLVDKFPLADKEGGFLWHYKKLIARVALSVVLADIKERPSEWVKACNCVKGEHCIWSEHDQSITFSPCLKCNGSGVVAVERKG